MTKWFESKAMKLGTAIAILTGAAVGTLYLFYSYSSETYSKETKKNQAEDKNFSKIQQNNYSKKVEDLNPLPIPELKNETSSISDPQQTLVQSIDNQMKGLTPNYQTQVEKVKHRRYTIEKDSPHLSMQLILLIHDALVEYSYVDFGKLIVESRRQRREVKDRDMHLYEEFVKNGTMCKVRHAHSPHCTRTACNSLQPYENHLCNSCVQTVASYSHCVCTVRMPNSNNVP